jgi:hypothetical protein
MKILYWRYFFTPPGGWGEIRGLSLVREWRKQGLRVWVLTSGSYFPEALRKRLRKRRVFRTTEGVPIIWFPNPLPSAAAIMAETMEFCEIYDL